MPKIIKATCPNCGAKLQLPESIDKTSSFGCDYCGAKVIIAAEEVSDQETEETNSCPMCKGKGITKCMGTQTENVTRGYRSYEVFVEGCYGIGTCQVSCYPMIADGYSNYCSNGKCAWCKGTGKYFLKKCPFCEGTGDCRFCNGTGRCKFCNGKGEIRCKRCNGTGLRT
ncbi:MAG: hypothetical protein JSV56_00690 [Methanomassiliicoccales archaeon]|nr:MAG: hypothetical protein JSV56_00690 [Methanomassiliicoccales archaeon]